MSPFPFCLAQETKGLKSFRWPQPSTKLGPLLHGKA